MTMTEAANNYATAQAKYRTAVSVLNAAKRETCLAWLTSMGAKPGDMFHLTIPGSPDYAARYRKDSPDPDARKPDKHARGCFKLNADNDLYFYHVKKNGEQGATGHTYGCISDGAWRLYTGYTVEKEHDDGTFDISLNTRECCSIGLRV